MQILKVIKHLNYSKQYDDYSPFVIVFNDKEAQEELDQIERYITRTFNTLEEIIESVNI